MRPVVRSHSSGTPSDGDGDGTAALFVDLIGVNSALPASDFVLRCIDDRSTDDDLRGVGTYAWRSKADQ